MIDPKSGAITATIGNEGTGHWIGILPDERKLYVTNKDDRPFVSVIDLNKRALSGKISAPNGNQGIAVSPDGKRVVAMDLADPVLILVDSATDKVIISRPMASVC